MKTIKKNLRAPVAFLSLMTAILCANASEPTPAAKISAKLVFTTSIVWIGTNEPPEAESLALLDALGNFETSGVKAGIAALESFLSGHQNSAWNASLHTHLAEHYRHIGRYTLAVSHWESAWNASKNATDLASREIAGRVAARWTRLLGSLGRKEQMDEIFSEVQRLGLDQGGQSFHLQATREGLGTMKTRPGVSYRCGSFALAQLMSRLQSDSPGWKQVAATPSPDGGFCLSELVDLAATNNCPVVAVQRLVGDTIVVPSVVHWKLDHYAAIVEKNGPWYLVMDPTFGGKKWLDAETINAETSGHFLVSATDLPPDWKALTKAEAKLIRGKGYPNDINDDDDDSGDDDSNDCPPPPPPNAGDGPGGGSGDDCPSDSPEGEGVMPDLYEDYSKYDEPEIRIIVGMPAWRVSEPYISLWVHDRPLFYKSSLGLPVSLKLSYNHRASSRGTNVGGFGDKWGCDWIGFLEENTNTPPVDVNNFLAGGGIEQFTKTAPGDPPNPSYKSARSLRTVTTNAAMTIESAYARQNQYGYPLAYAGGTIRYFLTNRMDQFGRSTRYGYERHTNGGSIVVRLTTMTDLDGKVCTLAYTNSGFPHLITSVTDPYSRTARFTYDNQGRLTNITDMAGLSSSFKYETTGSMTNLHTPYGDTSFRYYWGTNALCALNRAIEITEPGGVKQLYAYRDLSSNGIGTFDHSEAAATDLYRNSFHWNRQQYSALSENAKTNVLDMPTADYKKGSLKHWLHGTWDGSIGTVVGTMSGIAGPVLDTNSTYRVNTLSLGYVGQSGQFAGSLKRVTDIRWNFGANLMEISRNAWGRPTEFKYYRNLNWVTYSNEFNADGRILNRVWGPNGELMRRYGYHATLTNLLTSVTNALGDVIRYTYDSAVRVTSITHPSGLVTTNTYYTSGDYTGFLKSSVEIGFRTNSYSYLNGNRLSHTNELGLVRNFTWDSLNRYTSTSFPDGTTLSNVYEKLDLAGAKDRLGNWTRFGYNALRQLTARTNADGHVTLFDYCNCGSPSQITELNGSSPVITQFNYDLAGRRTNATYADGYYLNYVFANDYPGNDRGGPLRVEDPSGLAVHFEYADYSMLGKVGLSHLPDVTSDGYVMQRTFDQYGRLKQTVDRNGITVTNGYDVLGRLTNRVVIDFNGQQRGTNAFAYTARGLTNSTDELGYKTWFVFDAAGRLLSQTNANSEVLQFTYNPADQLLTLKDGKNQQTSWNYDQYGRVTNKLDATSTEIFRYKYDPNHRLTNRWTVAKGDTFYRYDVVGLLTNVDYPGTTMDITLTYDGLDRLTNVVDGIGTTKFTYTTAGQLLSEDGPWASDTVSYTYSARRRASLSVTQPNASPWNQTYGYDQYNRLSSVTSAAGPFGYTYWSWVALSDRVQYLGLPGNNTEHTYVENVFDELARLTSTTVWKSSTLLNQHGYQMNEANQRTRQTFSDGNPWGSTHYTEYTYDNIGQLKTARGTDHGYDYQSGQYVDTPRLQEQFGYAYDAAWNLQRRTNNALVQTFGVNNRNELTNATRSGVLTVAGLASERKALLATDYGITNVTVSGTGLSIGAADVYADGSWARTNATLADGNNSYTASGYDTFGRSASDSINLSLPSTINFQYDGNGNLTNDGRRVFEYDCENQLTNLYVANTWRSAFQYDAFGRRRVRKEYGWSGSAWTLTNEVRYVYDGMLVVQERDANNFALVSYTRGRDLSGSIQGAGGIGGLLARSEMSNLQSPHAYYHTDGNGNITELVDTNGFVVARYHYDPYGNLLGMAGLLAEANTYRFSSKEWHGNSGLYYYGFRYYEPNLQRWPSQDPLGDIGSLPLMTAGITPNVENENLVERIVKFRAESDSLPNAVSLNDVNVNLYGGIGNDPLNQVDPFGLDANSYADCIERYRNPITEQLPNAIAEKLGAGDDPFSPPYVQDALYAANAAANYAVGPTRRTGIGGKKPHPTTWQNKLGREIARKTKTPKIGQVGKWFGRAAVALTIFEGFWDIGLLAGCGIAEAIPD